MNRMFFRAILVSVAGVLCAASLRATPVEVIPPELRGAIQPQVAVAPGGRIHIVFGRGTVIYHVSSTDGRSFSAPAKVGEIDKLALGMHRGPRVAATDDMVVVTAISHSDGNIHVWTSKDTGSTWREGAKLNGVEKSAREGLHGLAGDGKGFVFVTWLDDRNGGKQIWGASSKDGGATWGENKEIYQSPEGHVCECCHPSVAVDQAGRVAVMWRNWLGGARDFYLAMSSDRGKTFSRARKLGDEIWKFNACPMDGGSVAMTAKGEPIAIWRSGKGLFATDAAPGERLLSPIGKQPIVMSTADSALSVWEADGRLMAQLGSAPAKVFAEEGRMVAGAARPGGGAILLWESTTKSGGTIMSDLLP